MTVIEKKLTIAGGPHRIEGPIPEVRGVVGGPWTVENPGEFPEGDWLFRFDTDADTVRIERAS